MPLQPPYKIMLESTRSQLMNWVSTLRSCLTRREPKDRKTVSLFKACTSRALAGTETSTCWPNRRAKSYTTLSQLFGSNPLSSPIFKPRASTCVQCTRQVPGEVSCPRLGTRQTLLWLFDFRRIGRRNIGSFVELLYCKITC
jgi:hypothetical protein